MNILCEGIPRCGKTTVINELASRLNLQIKKYENPKSKRETAELFAAYLMELKENKNVIYDRGHLSELVYGPLYRPRNYLGSDLLPRLLYGIDRILAKRGHTLVIYFWPLSQTIMDYEGREQYKPNFRTELTMYDGNCLLTFNIPRGDRDYIRIMSCSNCGAIAIRSLFSDDFGLKDWQRSEKKAVLCAQCNSNRENT